MLEFIFALGPCELTHAHVKGRYTYEAFAVV